MSCCCQAPKNRRLASRSSNPALSGLALAGEEFSNARYIADLSLFGGPPTLPHRLVERGLVDRDVRCWRAEPRLAFQLAGKVLRVRRDRREFGGRPEFIDVGVPAVLAHRCVHGDDSVLLLHKLGERKQSVTVRVREGRVAHDLLARHENAIGSTQLELRLAPFGYRWFERVW